MWPSKAFCRWLITHRLEVGRVKKKLKVDSKSTETIRSNLLLVFYHFLGNVERILGWKRMDIEPNSHSSSFYLPRVDEKLKSNFPPRRSSTIEQPMKFSPNPDTEFSARGIINGRVVEWTLAERLRKPRLRKFYDLTSAWKFVNQNRRRKRSGW